MQTGLGRTGTTWYFEQAGVVPDLLITGKGLGGGLYPVSAAVMTDKLEAFFDRHPFAYVSTFGGAELGCVVGSVVIDEISEPGFLDRVEWLGRRFESRFEGLPSSSAASDSQWASSSPTSTAGCWRPSA